MYNKVQDRQKSWQDTMYCLVMLSEKVSKRELYMKYKPHNQPNHNEQNAIIT
jgi:hypothetical protein